MLSAAKKTNSLAALGPTTESRQATADIINIDDDDEVVEVIAPKAGRVRCCLLI